MKSRRRDSSQLEKARNPLELCCRSDDKILYAKRKAQLISCITTDANSINTSYSADCGCWSVLGALQRRWASVALAGYETVRI